MVRSPDKNENQFRNDLRLHEIREQGFELLDSDLWQNNGVCVRVTFSLFLRVIGASLGAVVRASLRKREHVPKERRFVHENAGLDPEQSVLNLNHQKKTTVRSASSGLRPQPSLPPTKKISKSSTM